MANKKIEKPTERTYWIVYYADKSVMHAGVTEPNQVTEMEDSYTLETFTDESAYITRAAELSIDVDEILDQIPTLVVDDVKGIDG